MSKFDYNLYKSQVDNISLSKNQKDELLSFLNNSTDNKIVSADFSPKKPVKRFIAAGVALAVLVTSIIIFNMNFSKESSLKNVSVSVALDDSNSKSYRISEEPVLFEIDNNSSVEKGELKFNALDFYINGDGITSVDISSKNKNFIILTSRDNDDMSTEMTNSSYKNLGYKSFSSLGWMPSYENIFAFEKDKSKDYNKYFSDEINIVIYKDDNIRIEKTISISYDKSGNYIVNYS